MKKTISINISGLVFNIEEQAYQILQVYLDEIKKILSTHEGVEEIIEDIEARIAELFHEKLSQSKQVVTEADVEEVINIMGNPSQYKLDDDDEADATFKGEKEPSAGSAQKRFYRDSDEGIIGGVAAGLGHYFGIDPVIIRVILVLMFVLGGSGVLLYIILWVVIPEAATTAQKLQMRGQPVNVENIKDYVHNFKDEAKSGVSNASKSVRNAAKRSSTALSKVFNILGRVIGFGMMIFGLFFFVVALMIHFGSIGSFLVIEGDFSNNFGTLTSLVFPEGSASIGFWSLFLSIIIPIILVTTLGIKLLFQLRGKMRATFISGLVIWIVSICTLSYVGVQTGLEFRNDYSYLDKVEQNDVMTADTLFIEMDDLMWNDQTFDLGYNDYLSVGNDSIKVGFPLIKVQRSLAGEDVNVSVMKRSNGSSIKDAKSNAENVSYPAIFQGDKLKIKSNYSFPTADKIRGQYASLMVSLPIGKRIIFPGNMDNFPVEFEERKHFSDDFLEKPSVWEATEDGIEFIGVYRVGETKSKSMDQNEGEEKVEVKD
jgi:phage shock protein PspC (stress-responsive transcriptional regulator)